MVGAPASKNENGNVFEDLSGIDSSVSDNPYVSLIDASGNDPTEIQARYTKHREARNGAQKKKFIDDKSKVIIDPTLYRLVHPEQYPDFADERHCLVFWARPPAGLRSLIGEIQQQLLTVAPRLWLMPIECLHMTALEIDFARTAEEIDGIIKTMSEKIPEITDYPSTHRARLIKPMLSYDTAAIALSFVPAAGESLPDGRQESEDTYTYHHLRRDLYGLSKSTGVEVASRYVVPSAHLTIARFITQTDISVSEDDETPDPLKVHKLFDRIEMINADLRERYWPGEHQGIKAGGEWMVGQEKGLDCRKGTLWEAFVSVSTVLALIPARKAKRADAHVQESTAVKMVNVPKTRRTYCKGKDCKKHTQHKVTQYKAGKASLFAQGKRRYDRKQSGYGGQTKPVFHKKAKTTKKVVLRLECTACKTKAQLALKRCKHFELGGDKKTKGAALVF
ncbi:MAG: hypothetical protein Q9169_002715 [Polycauliona sp. 2 TL-2023]